MYLLNTRSREGLPIGRGIDLGRTRGDFRFVDDLKVSRLHCRLHVVEGSVFIEDLGSTNRTRLNRNRILPHTRVALRLDDVIEIGEPTAFEIATAVMNKATIFVRRSPGNQ